MHLIPFKVGIRSLARYKLFSLINILGLSLVYCSLFIISLYIYKEITTDNFHLNKDRILVINSTSPRPLADEIRNHIPGVDNTLRLRPPYSTGSSINNGEYSFNVPDILFSDNSFFDFFTFDLSSGNKNSCLDQPNSIVITKALSDKLFGTIYSIGKTISFNDSISLKVTGVFEEIPINSSLDFSALIPIEVLKIIGDPVLFTKWNYRDCETFLLISPSTDITAIKRSLKRVAKPMGKSSEDIGLMKYSKYYFHSEDSILRQGNLNKIWLFTGIASILLTIGIINYITMFSSLFCARRKGLLANQLYSGEKRSTIIQLITESILISLISAGLAILLIELIPPELASGIEIKSMINLYGKVRYLFTTISFSILIGILIGLLPALKFISENKISLLHFNQVYKKTFSIRRILIFLQILISTTLMICTVVVTRQVTMLNSDSLGFTTENIVCVRIPPDLVGKQEILQDKLKVTIGIEEFGFCSHIVGAIEGYFTAKLPGNDKIFKIQGLSADMNCLKLLDIDIIKQDQLNEGIRTKEQITLINETAVKELGFSDPIGKKLPGPPFYQPKIAGVVKDFHGSSYYEKILPLTIDFDPGYFRYIMIKTENNLTSFDKIISSVWSELASDYEPEYFQLDDFIRAEYRQEISLGRLLSTFTLLAVIIVFTGLFGLISFTSEQREKELSIRKINGARFNDLLKLLFNEYLYIFLVSFILSLPLSIWISGLWLKTFAYRISLTTDIFLISFLTVICTLFLAILFGVIRAFRKNPVNAISSD